MAGMAPLRSFARICSATVQHDDLLGYMAESSRIDTFDSKTCYDLLRSRVEFSAVSQRQRLNYTPQESNVFKVRFDVFANSNDAYRIGITDFSKLTREAAALELAVFSRIHPGWSLLFPLKMYLLDRPYIAELYQGFLPFGSEVIAWLHDVGFTGIGTSPTLADHVFLADYSAKLGRLHGWSTVTVNHYMYLEGKALAKRKVTPKIPPVGESQSQ